MEFNKITNSVNKNIKKFIIDANLQILRASICFFGRTIASSYLSDDTTDKIAEIDTKTAKRPNASGAYNLVIIGLDRINIIWAIEVPATI